MMTSTTTPGASGARLYRMLAAPLCLLVLAACSGEAESPPRAQADAASAAVGVLETSSGAYRFTPTTCAFHQEDGVYDIEIGGPGEAPDGEKFFFELTSTGQAIAVNLGADGPFASSDRKLVAGKHVSEEFTINVSGTSLSVPKIVLITDQGERVDENASLQIDCS
jgi:hypothetical protein